jgi:transcription elongation factor GreA
MIAEQTFITPEGLAKLKEELNHLKTVKRQEVAKRIQEAKELGDLSENAEYSDAKTEQAFTEGRIQEIEAVIRDAKIIEKDTSSSVVQIGSRILVKEDGDEKEFNIVGSNEADPIKGFISNESPMGKAFLGRKIGDKVSIEVPKGIVNFEIVEIS